MFYTVYKNFLAIYVLLCGHDLQHFFASIAKRTEVQFCNFLYLAPTLIAT